MIYQLSPVTLTVRVIGISQESPIDLFCESFISTE